MPKAAGARRAARCAQAIGLSSACHCAAARRRAASRGMGRHDRRVRCMPARGRQRQRRGRSAAIALSASASRTSRVAIDSSRGSAARIASPPPQPADDGGRRRARRRRKATCLAAPEHQLGAERGRSPVDASLEPCRSPTRSTNTRPGPGGVRCARREQAPLRHAWRAPDDGDIAEAALVARVASRKATAARRVARADQPGLRRLPSGGATPRRAHQTLVGGSRPLPVKRPGFGVIRVSVSSARTHAVPSGWPRSTSSPEGTSMARTRAPAPRAPRFGRSRPASAPSGAREAPMPSSASMTRSVGRRRSLRRRRTRGCRHRLRGRGRAPGSRREEASRRGRRAAQRCRLAQPHRCVAASMPSPPLLPGPAKTRRCAGHAAERAIARRARPPPARPMSVKGGSAASASPSIRRVAATSNSGRDQLIFLAVRCAQRRWLRAPSCP